MTREVTAYERELGERLGVEHVVEVSSGTAACRPRLTRSAWAPATPPGCAASPPTTASPSWPTPARPWAAPSTALRSASRPHWMLLHTRAEAAVHRRGRVPDHPRRQPRRPRPRVALVLAHPAQRATPDVPAGAQLPARRALGRNRPPRARPPRRADRTTHRSDHPAAGSAGRPTPAPLRQHARRATLDHYALLLHLQFEAPREFGEHLAAQGIPNSTGTFHLIPLDQRAGHQRRIGDLALVARPGRQGAASHRPPKGSPWRFITTTPVHDQRVRAELDEVTLV